VPSWGWPAASTPLDMMDNLQSWVNAAIFSSAHEGEGEGGSRRRFASLVHPLGSWLVTIPSFDVTCCHEARAIIVSLPHQHSVRLSTREIVLSAGVHTMAGEQSGPPRNSRYRPVPVRECLVFSGIASCFKFMVGQAQSPRPHSTSISALTRLPLPLLRSGRRT
jgi:hypothetical protein